MSANREQKLLAVTQSARAELLNSLEAVQNLLYVVQQNGAESCHYLDEMKQELQRAIRLLMSFQEC